MEDPIIMRRLMLIILTLGLASGQSNKVKYLVAAPAVMSPSFKETICVYCMSPEATSATLTISLTAMKTSSVFQTLIKKGDGQLHCKTLQVPPPMDGIEEIARLAINIKSDGLEYLEEKFVLIRHIRNGIFMQPDRPIYQPGEEIFIKAMEFDEKFMASTDMFSLISIKDDQSNIIKQWENVTPNSGILELSYKLSPDIREGEYTITANKNGAVEEVLITVQKFVLPKFKTTIDAQVSVTILQSNFPITICGKYTYGKPVRGTITGKMCRISIYSPDHPCKPINGKTDVNGCYTAEVDTNYFKFKQDGYNNYLDVEASLEEDGSGVKREAKKSIYISDILATVMFKKSRDNYKKGLDYIGWMTLTGPDGLAMPYKDIELYVNGQRTEEIYTADKNGVARFKIESSQFTDKLISLRARYLPKEPLTESGEREPAYEDGYASLLPSHTRSVSQVKIRGEPFVLPSNEKVNLWADCFLDASECTKKTIDFHYLIITRGRIVSSSTKRHTIPPIGGIRSFFPFPVTVTSDMSPAATILIYACLDNGELIADSIKMPVTSCFPNTVSLQFSEEQCLPGSMVNLHISAYPNSMCSIRAVDKSIELLKSDHQRSEVTVNEFLNDWDEETNGYPIKVEELQACPAGSIPVFDASPKQPDIFSLFERCRMKVLTNFMIQKQLDCILLPRPPKLGVEHVLSSSGGSLIMPEMHAVSEVIEVSLVAAKPAADITAVTQAPPPQEKVRKRFLNTWLINTRPIGNTGEMDYSVQAPDTITQWNVDAFCTSAIGLGFSPQTHLQVFKPFFLEMIMPYSVKQGETLVLKAVVLNFMRQCIKVQATLYRSKDFQLLPCEECSYSACLCSDPTYTFIWNIKPLTLGAINITIGTEALSTSDLCDGQTPIVPTKGNSDFVQKRLIVESHGIPVENTRSLLLCAFESETIPLELPENVVLGSQSAEVTVTADIMGKPLNNLNGLVQLPTGCGEQNMQPLATIIQITIYLGVTGQMTDEIMDKARGYMETGYQNELNFKHTDGSYSAFGNGDPTGSTWLTAFVVRFFCLCGKEIDIEYRHITEALDWLKNLQQSDGCFQNVGRVIHTELLGGVDSQLSLTAYVTSTFLIVKDPNYGDVIEKAKTCLEKCTQPQTSIHAKAQCAYTYTLLGDNVKRTQLLEQLDKVAIKKDNMTHWSTSSESPAVDPLWPKPISADVETTAYVVLAMVSGDDASKAELAAAVPANRWLYSQQNANGGFASTQDTVVALSAISAFGSKTFVDENMPTTTVTNDKGFKAEVTVNPQKPSEVLVVDLPHIPAVYTLEASGSGCAYVQVTERYNILDPEPEGTFVLQVKTSSIQCPPHPVPSFSIEISVSLRDTSKNEQTNMAIVVIKLISGFAPKEDTLNILLANDEVKKVENNQKGVTIYLEKITSTTILLAVEMEQQSEVKDLLPAVVFVKDYYETSKHIEKTYRNPC